MTQPWGRDEFESRVREVLEVRYHHRHPFINGCTQETSAAKRSRTGWPTASVISRASS